MILPKFVHANEQVTAVVVRIIVEHFDVNGTSKLISKATAVRMARDINCQPQDIEFSYPWYNTLKETMWIDHQLKLPLVTNLGYYLLGEVTEFNPAGLYRGTKDSETHEIVNWKGVLTLVMVVPLINSSDDLSSKLDNIRELAKTINDTWYGPPEDVLRSMLLGFASQAQEPEPMFQANDDLTATQQAAIYRDFSSNADKFTEAALDAVS